MGRFLGYTTFGSLTFGLVCGQLGVMCLGTAFIQVTSGKWSLFLLVLLVVLAVNKLFISHNKI